MNNLCPSCQALYNVRPKDVGRRVTCKKCRAALVVTDAGLTLDGPAAPADRPEDAFAGVGGPPRRRGRDRERSPRAAAGPLAGVDWRQTFRDLGGVPTLLFASGAFLVIVFLFQPLIGVAAVDRARGAAERLDLDWKVKERKLRKEKKAEDDISKAREEFYKAQGKDEVDEGAAYEAVSARRSRWLDLYGLMFGFLLLMAGSVGYTADRTSTVRRILGTVVLGAQMLIVFSMFAAGGGCGGAGPKGLP
ncbi:MAG: zinc-ribbon domain-containing protein [Gemmataceae bacterium]|nr:zinc-ribbon domain-containing protein [Gemmataceae bacterium]